MIVLSAYYTTFRLLSRLITVSAWGKLYKRELFNEVKFPEGKLYEDQGTTYKLIGQSKKIMYCDLPLYKYVQREKSIQNSPFDSRCFDELDLCLECKNYIETNYPQLSQQALNRLVSTCFHILYKYYDHKIENDRIQEVKAYIVENRKRCILSRKTSKKVKLGCLVTYLGWDLSYKIYSMSGARGRLG